MTRMTAEQLDQRLRAIEDALTRLAEGVDRRQLDANEKAAWKRGYAAGKMAVRTGVKEPRGPQRLRDAA